MIPFDLINGCFEAGGAIATAMNVRALMRDKKIAGVDWRMFVYYVSWGLYNLIYYPHLGQWLSFVGGCLIVVANLCWLGLAIKYGGARAKRQEEETAARNQRQDFAGAGEGDEGVDCEEAEVRSGL